MKMVIKKSVLIINFLNLTFFYIGIITDLDGEYYPTPENKSILINGFNYKLKFCVNNNNFYK